MAIKTQIPFSATHFEPSVGVWWREPNVTQKNWYQFTAVGWYDAASSVSCRGLIPVRALDPNQFEHQKKQNTSTATDTPVWGGEGLPPVGTVCEMSLFASDKWELCTLVYYLNHPIDHSDQVVVYQNSLGGDVCYILEPPCSGSIEFRPIRTPEQLSAEAREKAIAEIAEILIWDGTLHTPRVGAERLYGAGYRKVEVTK